MHVTSCCFLQKSLGEASLAGDTTRCHQPRRQAPVPMHAGDAGCSAVGRGDSLRRNPALRSGIPCLRGRRQGLWHAGVACGECLCAAQTSLEMLVGGRKGRVFNVTARFLWNAHKVAILVPRTGSTPGRSLCAFHTCYQSHAFTVSIPSVRELLDSDTNWQTRGHGMRGESIKLHLRASVLDNAPP